MNSGKESRNLKKKIKTLRNKCLRLWSKIIREKANGKCEICGETKYLNAHHIVGRRYAPLRLEPLNGIALCPKCHKFGIGKSAHENPIWFTEWLKEHKPIIHDFLKHFDYGRSIEESEQYYQNVISVLQTWDTNFKENEKNRIDRR